MSRGKYDIIHRAFRASARLEGRGENFQKCCRTAHAYFLVHGPRPKREVRGGNLAKPAGERWIVLGHTQTRHPSTAHTRPLTYQLAMSLFKKAQSAVAHNSKIPSLGNSDLKQLQEMIHREKAFVAANAKTATEIQLSSDALRAWGSNEGDDLEDILPKVALLFEYLSRAELRYNYYVSTMRLHLKSIRSREEKYAEFKGRRRALVGKIEAMERRLAKMGPENKDLAKVTSSLRELRSDMEVLNNEMAHEEAALGDYKRRTIVEALSLKSGGLMELAEKSIVIAESCRLLVEEVPLIPTVPNEGRAPYRNEARTNRLLQEAVRQLESITFEPRESQMNVDRNQSSPTSFMINSRIGDSTNQSIGPSAVGVAPARYSPIPGPAPGPSAGPSASMGGPGAMVGGADGVVATGPMGSSGMMEATGPPHFAPVSDVEQGSQGWVAPSEPMPIQNVTNNNESAQMMQGGVVGGTGLPTVHEAVDPVQSMEEPSRRYASPSQTMPSSASSPGFYEEGPEFHQSAMFNHSYGGMEASRPPQGAYQQLLADSGLNYASDAIPAFPPMPQPPSASQPLHMDANRAPEGRDNRQYLEGVGSTKALQAASAQSSLIPMPDTYMPANGRATSMYSSEPHAYRSLSPLGRQHTRPPVAYDRPSSPAMSLPSSRINAVSPSSRAPPSFENPSYDDPTRTSSILPYAPPTQSESSVSMTTMPAASLSAPSTTTSSAPIHPAPAPYGVDPNMASSSPPPSYATNVPTSVPSGALHTMSTTAPPAMPPPTTVPSVESSSTVTGAAPSLSSTMYKNAPSAASLSSSSAMPPPQVVNSNAAAGPLAYLQQGVQQQGPPSIGIPPSANAPIAESHEQPPVHVDPHGPSQYEGVPVQQEYAPQEFQPQYAEQVR